MSATVFISHSSLDSAVAGTLCGALEKRGITCWISSRDIGPGENFQEAIVNAVSGARVMVLVFSAHANNSDEIKKELALASQNRLTVIPTRVEDVMPTAAFKYELATRQWIDIFNDWERAVALLADQIREIAEREPAPESAAGAVQPRRPVGPPRRNLPLLAAGLAGVVVIVAGGAWFVVARPSPPAAPVTRAVSVSGEWVSGEFANVYDQNTKLTVTLHLDQSGDSVSGTATENVTGGGSYRKGIREGRVSGDRVTFFTPLETTDGGPGVTYKESYRGTIRDDVIDFVRQDDTPSGGDEEKFSVRRK